MIPVRAIAGLCIEMVLFSILFVCEASAAEPTWKAGFARTKITPTEAMWLSGYGSRDHASEGTRIELWAKALALEAPGGSPAVVVTLDLVGIDRESAQVIRDRIQKKASVTADRIALCSSHTHTGPVVGHNLETMYFYSAEERERVNRYTIWLEAEVTRIAIEALGRLLPSKLSWGVGSESFGVNRRNNPEALVPAHRAGGKLRGPVDYDVPVLRIADSEDRLLALLFGYACHATVLDDYLWSGDYPGYAQLELEQCHPGLQAMFIAGCGADVNPLPRRTPELAQHYGRRLATAVDRVNEGVLTLINPELSIRYTELDLPFDTLPTRKILEEKLKSSDRYGVAYAQKMLKELEAGRPLPTSYPYPMGVWKFGKELTWISLGGEGVVDYGLRLKREFGRDLWVSSYSHDVMAYIPSRRVWEEGGYEGGGSMIYYGLPTRWAGDVEERIFGVLKGLLDPSSKAR